VAEAPLHAVRIGTCGWSYKEWSGVFYPRGLAPGDYLPYLAQHYPVEVDSTFYLLVRPSTPLLRSQLLNRGQRVGIAGQEPAAVGLFAVYRDSMAGELRLFPAGARHHG